VSSDKDNRKIEELTPEELAPLLLKDPFELIVMNFIRSSKDSKTIRIPENVVGNYLYHGIGGYIHKHKLENIVSFYGHKISAELDTITLMKANGDAAKNYHHNKRRTNRPVSELQLLKTIARLSAASKLQHARIHDLEIAMNRTGKGIYSCSRKLADKGLITIASRGRGFCTLTDEGRKQLAESTKKL
jgi:hypothetical protein